MFPNEHAIPKCAVCTDWILISLQILCTLRDCKKKSSGVLLEWGHSSLFCMHRCMALPKQRIRMGQPGFGATQIFPSQVGTVHAEHSHPGNIFQGTIWSGCLSVFSALESFRTCQCSGAQQCAAPKRVHVIQMTVIVGNYMGKHWIQNWIHMLIWIVHIRSYDIYWYFIICQPLQSWPSLHPCIMYDPIGTTEKIRKHPQP
jgi:hypothetical protein